MIPKSSINMFLHVRFFDDTAFILESHGRLLFQALLETEASEHPQMKRLREYCKPQMTVEDGIAQIPIEGVLAYNPHPIELAFDGIEDSRNILAMVNEAANTSAVKGIQLNIDSPGGMKVGGFEIADAVANASRKKPVVAHIGGYGASLAYLIASQAREIVANRTAQVGSIGVYAVNIDTSGMAANAGVKVNVFKNKEAIYKAAGIPGTALSEDQQKNIQATVQNDFDEFSGMISAARSGIPKSAMQGQVFSGKQAKANGLIDRLGDSQFATGLLKLAVKST